MPGNSLGMQLENNGNSPQPASTPYVYMSIRSFQFNIGFLKCSNKYVTQIIYHYDAVLFLVGCLAWSLPSIHKMSLCTPSPKLPNHDKNHPHLRTAAPHGRKQILLQFFSLFHWLQGRQDVHSQSSHHGPHFGSQTLWMEPSLREPGPWHQHLDCLHIPSHRRWK